VTAPHASLRTRYLRTNSNYDPNSLQFAPPHFTVYDRAHRQFFMSNPYLNEIDVFDAALETQKAAISIPMAWGIDISPIDGSLWVGTFIGDVYNVDTAKLTLNKRYAASSIGPSGFGGQTALVLSDGRVALQGGAGGILGIDGFGQIVVWNPATNAIDTGTNGSVCPYTNGHFSLSGDRKLILNTTVDENETYPLCSYDPVAKKGVYASFPQQNVTFMREIIPTPDGSKFFLTTNLDGVVAINAQTLQVVGTISGGGSYDFPSAAGSGVVSLDGKTIYLSDQTVCGIEGFDTTTFQPVATLPHPEVNDSQACMLPSAIDETGLIAGPIGHGVGFADSAAPMPQIMNKGFYPGFATPNTGNLSGGTAISLGVENTGLSQFFVGNSLISGTPISSNQSVSVEVPNSSVDVAVDLTVTFADGTISIAPESFSYGPVVLEAVPSAATADGGQTAAVVGYGFGTSVSGLQVTVAGRPATIQTLHLSAPISPYPFPVEVATFTIPAGATGAADLTVTSPSGTTTIKGGFHYTAAAQSFPLSATLQEGIYDRVRGLYLFTDTNKIQVLNRNQGGWGTPISLPGSTSATQLLGLAESPSGNYLAVADYGGQAVYVLNPGDPTSAMRYPMPQDYFNQALAAPTGVAVLDSGKVYITSNDIGGTGENALWTLAPGTSTMTKVGNVSSGGTADKYDRLALSPDGQTLYGEVEGVAFRVATATDTFTYASNVSDDYGGNQDVAISEDGSTLTINGFIADKNANPINVTAYVDWETWLPSAVLGQKLSPDGSLLYQPLTDGIDVISRNSGRLLFRVQVPGAVSGTYDALFTTESASTLGVITTMGVSFLDLSSLPLPTATPFPTLAAERDVVPSASLAQGKSVNATKSDRSLSKTRPRLRSHMNQKRDPMGIFTAP
jgi:hypothetical protein